MHQIRWGFCKRGQFLKFEEHAPIKLSLKSQELSGLGVAAPVKKLLFGFFSVEGSSVNL